MPIVSISTSQPLSNDQQVRLRNGIEASIWNASKIDAKVIFDGVETNDGIMIIMNELGNVSPETAVNIFEEVGVAASAVIPSNMSIHMRMNTPLVYDIL